MITSLSNGRVKNVIQLMKKSKLRREQGVFVVEGLRMVREAPADRVLEVYASESFLRKEENRNCLKTEVGCPFETVSDEVFARMSDTVSPQGILCVVRQKVYSLAELLSAQNGTFLVLEDVQDPGNLGTMLRTGEGAGIAGVIMSSQTVDLYNPKVIRSTMGSVYRVPHLYVDDLKETLQCMKDRGIHTYAAHLAGSSDYDSFSYTEDTAFLIGNEGNGLTKETADLAEYKIRIPMLGQVESLNAAVSASVLMYEALRQRRIQKKI